MAKYTNTIEYKLKTTIDSSGIAQLKTQLQGVQKDFKQLAIKNPLRADIAKDAIQNIEKIKQAYTNAFDPTTGLLNLKKLQRGIDGVSLAKLERSFSHLGAESKNVFNQMLGTFGKVETGVKSMSSSMDKMINTFGNTIRWGASASIIQTLSNRLYDAVQYVKDLDRSLNDIRIVTGLGAENMREFTFQANEAAKALGQTTVGFTNASLIFAQQGYDLKASADLAALTLKTANVTGQETAEVSEQLTSLLNGFKINGNDIAAATAAVDKLAKVAAVGAADLEELATAESKVASTANTLGVSQDQLVAQLSTIISVTRQAPENVGNAMKTIYARLGDLKMGETLEDGTDLGQIGVTLDKIGISLLDTTGNMRNMGDVIEELMDKWDELNTAEKQAVAVKLAGKYQYNNLLALLENADMYNQQLQASYDSLGTINEQQEVFMESMEGKTKALQAAFEGFMSTIADPDVFKPLIAVLTEVVSIVDQFVNAIGGAGPMLGSIASIFAAKGANTLGRNFATAMYNKNVDRTVEENERVAKTFLMEEGLGSTDEGYQSTIDYVRANSQFLSRMDEQQRTQHNTDIENRVANAVMLRNAQAKLDAAESVVMAFLAETGMAKEDFMDSEGNFDTDRYDSLAKRTEYELFDLSSPENYKLAVSKAKEAYASSNNILQNVFSAEQDGKINSKAWNKYRDEIKSTIEAMENNGKVQAEMLKNMDLIDQSINDGIVDIKQYTKAVDGLNRRISKYNEESSSIINKKGFDAIKAAEEAKSEHDLARQGLSDLEKETYMREYTHSLQMQASGFIQAAGAAGMLISAMQSLQNIGSIWSNDDLDMGEKLLQTFENMIFVLPMVVSSISELRQGLDDMAKSAALQQAMVESGQVDLGFGSKKKNKKNKKSKNNNKNQNQQDNNSQETQEQIDQAAEAAVIDMASYAVVRVLGSLAKILPKLFSPVGIAILVGSLLTKALYDGIKESEAQIQKQNWEKLTAEVTEATEKAASMSSRRKTIESMFEEYEDTGKATESFISTLREVGKEFDIQSTDALIASGSFDVLRKQINDAADAAEREATLLKEQQLEEAKRKMANAKINTEIGVSWYEKIWINLQVILQGIIDFWNNIVVPTFSPWIETIESVTTSFGNWWDKTFSGWWGGVTHWWSGVQNWWDKKEENEHATTSEVEKNANEVGSLEEQARAAGAKGARESLGQTQYAYSLILEGRLAEAQAAVEAARASAIEASNSADSSMTAAGTSQTWAEVASAEAEEAQRILDVIRQDYAAQATDVFLQEADIFSGALGESPEDARTLLEIFLQHMYDYGVEKNIPIPDIEIDGQLYNIADLLAEDASLLNNLLSGFDSTDDINALYESLVENFGSGIDLWFGSFKYERFSDLMPSASEWLSPFWEFFSTARQAGNTGGAYGFMADRASHGAEDNDQSSSNKPTEPTEEEKANYGADSWQDQMQYADGYGTADKPEVEATLGEPAEGFYWSYDPSSGWQQLPIIKDTEEPVVDVVEPAIDANELISSQSSQGFFTNPLTGEQIDISGTNVDFMIVRDNNGNIIGWIDNKNNEAILINPKTGERVKIALGDKTFGELYSSVFGDLLKPSSKSDGSTSYWPNQDQLPAGSFGKTILPIDNDLLLQSIINEQGVLIDPQVAQAGWIGRRYNQGLPAVEVHQGVDNTSEYTDIEDAVREAVVAGVVEADASKNDNLIVQQIFKSLGYLYNNTAPHADGYTIDDFMSSSFMDFVLSDGTVFNAEDFYNMLPGERNDYVEQIYRNGLDAEFVNAFYNMLLEYAQSTYGLTARAEQIATDAFYATSAESTYQPTSSDDQANFHTMAYVVPLGGTASAPVSTTGYASEEAPQTNSSANNDSESTEAATSLSTEELTKLIQEITWAPGKTKEDALYQQAYATFLQSDYAKDKNFDIYSDYVGTDKQYDGNDPTWYLGYQNALSSFAEYLASLMDDEGNSLMQENIYFGYFVEEVLGKANEIDEVVVDLRNALYTLAVDQAQNAEYDTSLSPEEMVAALLENNPDLANYYETELGGDILLLLDLLQQYVEDDEAEKRLDLYEAREEQRRESTNKEDAEDLIQTLIDQGISEEYQTALLSLADATINEKAMSQYVKTGKEIFNLSDAELIEIFPFLTETVLRVSDVEIDNDLIQEELDRLYEDGSIAKVRIGIILRDNQENSDKLRTASMEDKAGKTEIRPFASDALQAAFDSAENQSESLGDIYSLLGNGFDDQMSSLGVDSYLDTLGQGVQSIDIANKVKEIEKLENEIGTLTETVDGLAFPENMHEAAVVFNDDLSEMIDKLDLAYDELEDLSFDQDINIFGDSIDQAQQLIEAIDDVAQATQLVDENLQVSPDNLMELVSIYPDILDSATITAEGMIQLDQAVYDSSIGLSKAKIGETVEETATRLEAEADYAQAKSDMYKKEAETLKTALESEVVSSQTADDLIGQSEKNLSDYQTDIYADVDAAALTAEQNKSNYSAESADEMALSMLQGTALATGYLGKLDESAYNVMKNIGMNAFQAATAIGSIGTDNPYGGVFSQGGKGLVFGSRVDLSEGGAITAGESITASDAAMESFGADGVARLTAKYEEYLAKSDAYNDIAGMLRGYALSARGKALIANNNKDKNSGGGGGEYTPKQKEYAENELDRYQKVNAELEDVASNLEKIAKEEDRIIGNDYAENIRQQIDLTKDQINALEEKKKIQEEERDEYKKELEDIYGITFDENGFIQNYADVYVELLSNLNGLTDQYNAATSEAEQEAYEQAIELAKEAFDNYSDLIEKYDDLQHDQIHKTENEIISAYDTIEDKQIELFKRSLDSIDSMSELNDVVSKFTGIMTGLGSNNPLRGLAESLSAIDTDNVNYWLNAMTEINKQRAEFNSEGSSSIFGENETALAEKEAEILESTIDAIINEEEKMLDLQDSILDIMDDQSDRMEERIEQYDRLNAELEHQRNLVELIRGEEAYDDINDIIDAMAANNAAKIAHYTNELEYWQGIADSTDPSSETYKQAMENIYAAQEEIDGLVEESLGLYEEKFQNAINKTVDGFSNALANTDDLEWMQEEWELINRNSEQYLDNVNSAYEIQKLQGKYVQLLDEATDPSIQKEITKQMNEQMKLLREKDKLSQYDVEYANAQLEILQKRIALEDAQRNKNQMRLKRDAQGNYSYVYTADENQIAEAQQALADAQNNAYNLSKNNIIDVYGDALSQISEASSMIKNIMTDKGLSEGDKESRVQTIYNGLMEYLTNAGNMLSTSEANVVTDLIDLVGGISKDNIGSNLQQVFNQILGGNKGAITGIDPRFNTEFSHVLQSMEHVAFEETELYKGLSEAQEQWKTSSLETLASAGDSYDDFGSAVKNVRTETDRLNQGTKEFFDTISAEGDKLIEAQAKVDAYNNSLAEMCDRYEGLFELLESRKNVIMEELKTADALNVNISGMDVISEKVTDISGYVKNLAEGFKNLNLSVKTDTNGNIEANLTSMSAFDTGGYTGTWNDGSGKLAMLHSKELVLNANDTINILKTVTAVRDMANMMKQGAITNVFENFANTKFNTSKDSISEGVSVCINAEFPNAYSAEEIKGAFMDLNEQAIQYLYKNR